MPPLDLPHRNFELAKRVDAYVAGIQAGYSWAVPKEPKLVRDAVHGYQLLSPHEVAVVDSPLVQRLRRIHQTALAFLVYPTATHTRFDHSLGVAKMVQGMVHALQESEALPIPDSVMHRVRLAALLHDTGHIFFSHLGESLAGAAFSKEIGEAKAVVPALFEGKSFGEILSYLMVTSPKFAGPLDTLLANVGLHDVTTERIAPLILGRSTDDGQQFEADMISGPFDADKLDYLLRDCHFSGIRTTVDIERVYYTVRLLHAPGQPRSLAMHISGVPNLEQILFSKMILYTSVYHHQKVRALECHVRGIFERLLTRKDDVENDTLKLTSLGDWLSLGEQDLFVLGAIEPVIQEPIRALLNRKLLKRALVISMDTVTPDSQSALIDLYNDQEASQTMLDCRGEIHGAMNKRFRGDPEDLWLDLPAPPTVIKDVLQVKITADQKSHRPLSSDRFQWEKWTNNYGVVKWRAHVFCRDNEAARRSAAHAAKKALKKRYGMKLLEAARELAKN